MANQAQLPVNAKDLNSCEAATWKLTVLSIFTAPFSVWAPSLCGERAEKIAAKLVWCIPSNQTENSEEPFQYGGRGG